MKITFNSYIDDDKRRPTVFKRLAACVLALVCGFVALKAEGEPDFVPGQLYSITNRATGTSLMLGAPSVEADVSTLHAGIAGVWLSKSKGGWQILSPCGGVFVYNWQKEDWKYRVFEDSDFEVQITPYEGYYQITYPIFGKSYYMSSDDLGASISDLDNFTDGPNRALWEITPLPAGAILDVPERVEMANRAFPSEYEGNPACAWRVELDDAMGFACSSDVVAETLTFTRELKAGWQGLCAPFALDPDDWSAFGRLYYLADASEETDDDGQTSLNLRFVEADEFEPNRPYLIYVERPGTLMVEKSDCMVSPSATVQTDIAETASARCELACAYDFTEVSYSDGDTRAYALSGGTFKRPSPGGVTLKPYRVLLTVTAMGRQPARIAVKTDAPDQAGVVEAQFTPVQPQVYDLSGRPAASGARGLLISSFGKVLRR